MNIPQQKQKGAADDDHFGWFYQRWINQLQEHLQRLVSTPKHHPELDHLHEAIAADLAAHHREYYTAKWAAARKDVLVFFNPPWLTPLETAHLWITGWKPSTAFRLVLWLGRTRVPLTSLAQLGEEQRKKVEGLRLKVRMEEEKVERDMERKHVALADRKIVELARVAARRRGGGEGVDAAAVEGLVAGMERVVKEADMVRLKTLKGLLEMLNPKQGMDFLAVFSMVLLQQRRWGTGREKTVAAAIQ